MNKLREEIRKALSENLPSIAEDSGLPEWTMGELSKATDQILNLIKERLPEKKDVSKENKKIVEKIFNEAKGDNNENNSK